MNIYCLQSLMNRKLNRYYPVVLQDDYTFDGDLCFYFQRKLFLIEKFASFLFLLKSYIINKLNYLNYANYYPVVLLAQVFHSYLVLIVLVFLFQPFQPYLRKNKKKLKFITRTENKINLRVFCWQTFNDLKIYIKFH